MASNPLLLVHAHPDDEVLTTGGVMAQWRAMGEPVTLVTCTLGEEGEILLPEIAHLAADQEDGLGEYRLKELSEAMTALGGIDSRILGEPGKYRDSGMMGEPSNDRPDCFWQADLREAATDLVAIIREIRPAVLITYDDFGGYGHPDHIQAHRVAMYATQLAAVASYRPDLGAAWQIPNVYWGAIPRGQFRKGIETLQEIGDTSDFASMNPDDLPFGIDDELVELAVDISDVIEQKQAAMRAHASQINLSEGFFSLSNNYAVPIFGTEYFRLAAGVPAQVGAVSGAAALLPAEGSPRA